MQKIDQYLKTKSKKICLKMMSLWCKIREKEGILLKSMLLRKVIKIKKVLEKTQKKKEIIWLNLEWTYKVMKKVK